MQNVTALFFSVFRLSSVSNFISHYRKLEAKIKNRNFILNDSVWSNVTADEQVFLLTNLNSLVCRRK